MYVCMYVCIRVYIYTPVRMCIYIYTYTHIYIYIYISIGRNQERAMSRFSGEPETINATHKTDKRLHITQTKDCT